jgi:peptide-methionine (S)-S-oxide reductase
VILSRLRPRMVNPDEALKGRADYAYSVPEAHAVTGHSIHAPWPEGYESVVVAMGCFWGAERIFWQTEGVWTTAVGYAGGFTPFPTYEETCTGRTGHTEVVLVVYDPAVISFEGILKVFWESHDPTQGFRQGNDMGTQYRSAIYTTTAEQAALVQSSAKSYGEALAARGHGAITSELGNAELGEQGEMSGFYYAEDHHQQYLHKNPRGYCGIGGTGVSCPIGLGA